MRTIVIIISIAIVVLFVSQAFVSGSSTGIEMYPYEVVKKYDSFEIRQYESRNFSYVTMPEKSYKESSSKGFRMLAGYIFGDNDRQEKIAMTSPVSMTMGDSITMAFMIPNEYDMEDLPIPGNSKVDFKTEPARTMAVIRFGGWANDTRIAEHRNKLIKELAENEIAWEGDFMYMGYNPPYEVMNRRNEVAVEVILK